MYQLKNHKHIGLECNIAFIKVKSPVQILLESNYNLARPLFHFSNNTLTNSLNFLDIKKLIRIEQKIGNEYEMRQEVNIYAVRNQFFPIYHV